ncbi:uncharacterized protein [Populus alba]|uniref:uncharacterized protein n=1 Tax=Populus alba TaxID=43335 RepID=UPI00158D8A3A|nr:uncharacterized protein LOC118037888 [Populus alba]
MNPPELNPFALAESSGLRDDIRLDVKIKHPTTLFDTISVTRFGVTLVDYLGHVISEQGVSIDLSKILAIMELPTPTTIKGVRGFLGLARVGIGAVLSQNNCPIAYFNEALKGSTLTLSIYEKEMLAIKLQYEVAHDPFFKTLVDSTSSTAAFLYRDGVWFNKGKIYLSPTSSLLKDIIMECHSSPMGGHFGYHKTLSRLKQSFSWPQMRGTIKEFLRSCDVCQLYKTYSMRPAGLLRPLSIPDRVWTDISMDFIEGLPPSSGHTVVMVVIDRLSKYAYFVPMKHLYIVATVAQAFVSHIVRLHGILDSIVSDRDRVFISFFFGALLFQLQGTKLCMSSSYHPQTDGQTKVINRVLEQYLRCFAGDQPRKWIDWIPWEEFCYNTLVHSVTKMTPFKAMYGVPPPNLLMYVLGTSNVQAVDGYLRNRDAIITSVAFRSSLKLSPSMLKKHVGPVITISTQLPHVTDKANILPQPKIVLDRRVVQKGQYHPKVEVLIKWKGTSNDDATWEDERRLAKSYPAFLANKES